MSFPYQSDAAFVAILPHVLKVEGGYVNHPNDPGGPTKFGVAWNYNAERLKKMGLTAGTMRNLTKEQAIQIYYENYWLSAHCHRLHDRKLQLIHFDAAVNHGVGAARVFKARTHAKFGKNPEWLEGNGKNPDFFWRCYVFYLNERIKGYTTYKNRASFLEGWMNRLEIINDTAVTFA